MDPSYYPPQTSSGGGGGGGIGPAMTSGYAAAPLDAAPAAAAPASSGFGDFFTPKNIAIGAAIFVGGIVLKKVLHA